MATTKDECAYCGKRLDPVPSSYWVGAPIVDRHEVCHSCGRRQPSDEPERSRIRSSEAPRTRFA